MKLFSIQKCLSILMVMLLLFLPSAFAEQPEQIWVEDVMSPVYVSGNSVSLCLRNASGHLFMRVEQNDSLLLSTDCGCPEGVFISEPYYFSEAGEYRFTLEGDNAWFSITVIVGATPCPTEYSWIDF